MALFPKKWIEYEHGRKIAANQTMGVLNLVDRCGKQFLSELVDMLKCV